MRDAGDRARPGGSSPAGTTLKLAGIAIALLSLAGLFASFGDGGQPGNASAYPASSALLNPVGALMALVGAIVMFVLGVLLSSAGREAAS